MKLAKPLIILSKPFRTLLDAFLYRFWLKRSQSFGELKNSYKDKPLLIVGNGPSLNRTPLDAIGIDSIGMNKIDMLFSRTKWRPKFIITVNGFVIGQNSEFFNSSEIPLFLPTKAFYLGIKRRPGVYFFRELRGGKFKDPDKGLIGGATVTYSAMQMAYYLGANPVYLVGIDHSFKFSGKPNEVKKMTTDDENHFDKNYFKGQKWGLPDLDGSELNYQEMKEMFEADGRKIYDATIGGKLEIFEKIDISQVIADHPVKEE